MLRHGVFQTQQAVMDAKLTFWLTVLWGKGGSINFRKIRAYRQKLTKGHPGSSMSAKKSDESSIFSHVVAGFINSGTVRDPPLAGKGSPGMQVRRVDIIANLQGKKM